MTKTKAPRLPHPAWSTRDLGSYLARNGIPNATPTVFAMVLVLIARADDRTGIVTIANDELAAAAGVHRSTYYRHKSDLEATGLVVYRPGDVTAGRGHVSTYRVVKTKLVAVCLEARRRLSDLADVRRQATTEVAARLGTVHRTIAQRVRDARYKTSHTATHPAPSGAGNPAPRGLLHTFIGDPAADLYCFGCQLPPTHPRHAVSLT